MAERTFAGRKRHPVKIFAYGLLTFGIYNRVFTFRTLREIDGHEALFLDLRVLRLLLWLPIIGPWIAKWRLANLLPRAVQHDAAAAPVHVRFLKCLALVPVFPLFPIFVQLHLSPHWDLHRKVDDLAAKREILVQLQASRRKEDQDQAAELSAEIRRREQALRDHEEAALALRAAAQARRQAEEEIRKAGGRKLRLRRLVAALPRPRRSPPEAHAAPPAAETPPSSKARDRTAAPPGGAFETARGRFSVLRRRVAAEARPSLEERATGAPGSTPEPGEGERKLSWRERRALKKEAKAREKQEKREAMEKARQEKREAKERAKQEKARLKEERRPEKEAPSVAPIEAAPAPARELAPSAGEPAMPVSTRRGGKAKGAAQRQRAKKPA